MCLIEIKLTEKASERGNIGFLYLKYKRFFEKSTLVYKEMQKSKLVVRIYVHFPENYVSHMCREQLARNSKIEKITILS